MTFNMKVFAACFFIACLAGNALAKGECVPRSLGETSTAVTTRVVEAAKRVGFTKLVPIKNDPLNRAIPGADLFLLQGTDVFVAIRSTDDLVDGVTFMVISGGNTRGREREASIAADIIAHLTGQASGALIRDKLLSVIERLKVGAGEPLQYPAGIFAYLQRASLPTGDDVFLIGVVAAGC